jgi:hypothetical protein
MAKNVGKDKQGTVPSKKEALPITIQGKSYFPQKDLINTWSFEQNTIAKPLILELYKTNPVQDTPQEILAIARKGKDATEEENIKLEQFYLKRTEILISSASQWNKDNEVLALIYFNEGESEFDSSTYVDRCEAFKKVKMADFVKAGDLYVNFFNYIFPYTTTTALTFSSTVK